MIQLSELKSNAHIHFMGICGTAMASLAGMLKEMGFYVTGSDQNVYPPMSTQLQEQGIEISEGYRRENLDPKPDYVVVGNVISRHFEEAQALLESQIPYTSLPAALGEIAIGERNSVVIAGTHGKTTTTAMMSWIAETCGKKPGFLIGGIPLNFPRSFRPPQKNNSSQEWFIIEGDEYDTAFFDKVPKFVHYRPKYVILTSIEFDHADIYQDLNAVLAAFKTLLQLMPEDGILIYNSDDKNIPQILEYCRCKKISYGLETGDYCAIDRANVVGRNQFTVEVQGERFADVALKLFGPHNTLNALAAFALSKELGWEEHLILQGLASFQGVKRRQEVIGEPHGIVIVEDFAHHPTAVELTVQTMREKYPQKKLIAVFEPRSATSRRKTFQQDYIKALSGADVVFLPPAFHRDTEPVEQRFSSEEVIAALKSQGVAAESCQSVDEIVQQIKKVAKSGDVILIMSNGGFGGIYSKLLAEL